MDVASIAPIVASLGSRAAALPAATGFALAKAKAAADSGNVNILVIGDSTGNDATEWPYLFAQWLGSTYPAFSVDYRLWNGTSYDAATAISTGSGSHKVTLWNASVTGTRPIYILGSRFADAVAALSPDAIVWNHGKNVYSSGLSAPHFRGDFFSGFDAVRAAHPTVPFVPVLQSPNRDDDNMAAIIDAERAVAGAYGIRGFADVYSPFMAQGKASSLYADNIHPSATGTQVFLAAVQDAWNRSSAAPSVSAALLGSTVANLLTNGDFSNWTAAVPASWTAQASVTASKDTGTVDGGSAYSMKLTGTSASASVIQNLTGSALTPLLGNNVVLAARQYIPSGQATTVGRIGVLYTDGGNTTTSARSGTYGVDAWGWQVLGPIAIPATATLVRVILYCDTAANASSAAFYDRAVLALGDVPRDMA